MVKGPCEYCGGSGKLKHQDEEQDQRAKSSFPVKTVAIGAACLVLLIGGVTFAMIASHPTQVATNQTHDSLVLPGPPAAGQDTGRVTHLSGFYGPAMVVKAPAQQHRTVQAPQRTAGSESPQAVLVPQQTVEPQQTAPAADTGAPADTTPQNDTVTPADTTTPADSAPADTNQGDTTPPPADASNNASDDGSQNPPATGN
jgi:hypothetical protein